MGIKMYSKEDLLNQIRTLTDGGEPPTKREFEKCPDTASAQTIQNRFGSWNKGVQAAGCAPVGQRYTAEELINQIHSLGNKNTPPTKREFEKCPETASSSTIQYRFGSWDEGIRAAGYTPPKPYTNEELLNQIRTLADKDTPPTYKQFETCPGTASSNTVAERFGSWNKGVRAAGYTPIKQTYTNEELLNQIRALAEEDTPPKKEKFEKCPDTASAKTIQNRFGSWNEGIRVAGYTLRERGYNKKELMISLQRAASTGDIEQLRHTSSDDCDYPSEATYQNYFGGIPVASLRGSINIDYSKRRKAVPLTRIELEQFVAQIPQADVRDQATALVSLLTGCTQEEHRWVNEEGIEDTETDPMIVFPSRSKRGTRSVSIGPLYNQFVRIFDPITPERLMQSVEFSTYPSARLCTETALRRVSREIDFSVDRSVIGDQNARFGPRVLHRDLRCTHYLFEYCQGASRAMLKRRLALSNEEIKHYHRFLNDPVEPDEDGWSVVINWRD